MSNPAHGRYWDAGQSPQHDYFSEERGHYAAVAYARIEASNHVRHQLDPLIQMAERLALELEGEQRRQAEELRDALQAVIRRAG